MHVLVTGGAGFIGTTLTTLLLHKGHHVVCYDNLLFNHASNLLPFFRNPRYTFIKGDICDERAVRAAMQGVDRVVHLAAIVGQPACEAQPAMAYAVNIEGTRIVDRARGGIPMVFASTGSVYGRVEDMCNEDTTPNPLTLYGSTKLEAENIVRATGSVCVFRFATAFGLSSRMRLDLMPNDFTYKLVVNRYLKVYEPEARRTFLHVLDIAGAIHHALKYLLPGSGLYNCGDNHLNCTKRSLVEMICSEIGGAKVDYDGQGHDADMRDYEVNYEKLRRTGFMAMVRLEDGIREMARAFQVFRLVNPYTSIVGG